MNLYLGIWGGRRGKIWWDDVRLGPGGLVNIVRRDSAPLRATSTAFHKFVGYAANGWPV